MHSKFSLAMRLCIGLATFALMAGTLLLFTCRHPLQAQGQPLYRDPTAPLEARVEDALKHLSLNDKLNMIHGGGWTVDGCGTIGLPGLQTSDGALGLYGAVLLPGGPCMAATWDPDIMQRIGKCIGENLNSNQQYSKILLGPVFCIHRTPFGGRNGESFSEDPYLAGVIGTGYIEGLHQVGTDGTIKHFACNNQELNRMSINVHVSDRALREIYLPAFQMAVQEGKASFVMDAYNKINGPFCSANDYLLDEILRKEWGFNAMVMSDWGAVHETLGAVMAGNDVEMPDGKFLNPGAINPLLTAGTIPLSVIDDDVRGILRADIRIGLLDGPKNHPNLVGTPEQMATMQQAAEEGIVLLKNDPVTAGADGRTRVSVLPIDRTKVKSIAVIGELAARMPQTIGGSAWVDHTVVPTVNPLDALKAKAGPGVTVAYARGGGPGGSGGAPTLNLSSLGDVLTPPAGNKGKGLLGEYFKGIDLTGTPTLTRVDQKIEFNWSNTPPDPALGLTNYSVRWTGTLTAPRDGSYDFGLTSDDGSRLFLDDKQVIDNWGGHGDIQKTCKAVFKAGQQVKIKVEYYQGAGLADVSLQWHVPGVAGTIGPLDADEQAAVDLAKQSDVAVVCVGTNSDLEGEGHDRSSITMPGKQDALCAAVCAANPRTIVVMFSGGVIVPGDWVKDVPAILEAYYPGNEGGTALANILYGDVNPSGRMPDTIGKKREDFSDYPYYPSTDVYGEGIYVGYRHFDKDNIEPLFCFGQGLSYTTFKYSNLKFTPVAGTAGVSPAASPDTMQADGKMTVSVDVTNTGDRAGQEVVQMYIHDPQPRIDKAPQELKGFARVSLKPGEMKTVSLTLDGHSLAYVDEANKRWVADAGVYEVRIGASSRDILLTGRMKLADMWKQDVPGMKDTVVTIPAEVGG